jgi:hypothetical protein
LLHATWWNGFVATSRTDPTCIAATNPSHFDRTSSPRPVYSSTNPRKNTRMKLFDSQMGISNSHRSVGSWTSRATPYEPVQTASQTIVAMNSHPPGSSR